MLIGYRIDRIELEVAIASKLGLIKDADDTTFFDPNDCQETIDALGEKEGFKQDMLGFAHLAFYVGRMESTSIKDIKAQLRQHTKRLKELAELLTSVGVKTDVEDAELITPSEWTRHGVCLNYD